MNGRIYPKEIFEIKDKNFTFDKLARFYENQTRAFRKMIDIVNEFGLEEPKYDFPRPLDKNLYNFKKARHYWPEKGYIVKYKGYVILYFTVNYFGYYYGTIMGVGESSEFYAEYIRAVLPRAIRRIERRIKINEKYDKVGY
jgi:hypothetical protein